MKTQKNALNDLAPSLGNLLTHWSGSYGYNEKIAANSWTISFNVSFLVCVCTVATDCVSSAINWRLSELPPGY